MTSNRTTSDTTSTIIRQQEQEQQDNQEKNGSNTRRDDYYNNYYPARTCARAREDGDELPPQEVMQQIARVYHENINAKITRVAAGVIERALKNGMEPATVILAIEETGMASRPSPYYLAAVLRNWAETGVVLSRSQGCADVMATEARPWWK